MQAQAQQGSLKELALLDPLEYLTRNGKPHSVSGVQQQALGELRPPEHQTDFVVQLDTPSLAATKPETAPNEATTHSLQDLKRGYNVVAKISRPYNIGTL